MPKHSHTRGTMNITGGMSVYSYSVSGWGAFSQTMSNDNVLQAGNTQDANFLNSSFDASRSWTGATSEEGESQAFNVMQPYISVYIWKRTA